MIDKNGKIFGKISIIDIGIVLLVLVVGLFVVNRLGLFSPKETLTTKQDKLQIVFYQPEVNSFTANNVKLKDPTTETLQNMSFGNVVDISIGDSVSWGSDIDGNQTKTTKEGYSSINITTETNGTLGPNGISLGGSTYYIGQFVTLRVGTSIFYGIIREATKI